MTIFCRNVKAAIRTVFGESTAERSRTPVSGGCINDTAVLLLSNNERVFLKENTDSLEGMFAAEAAGLFALHSVSKRVGGPVVPAPLAVGAENGRQFILLEYIAPGRPGPRYAEDFGRAFAALHLDKAETRFGFETDNFIGATPQINTWSSEWISFFGENRLGFQIELARRKGLASSDLEREVRRLIDRLVDFIPSNISSALLHGDLWSGNAMVNQEGSAVIIDPATYYGHHEADLAMTELFGRFPERFYAAYNELLPIPAEYRETRRTIYGLYHILNHLNLFGGGYASQAKSMMRQVL